MFRIRAITLTLSSLGLALSLAACSDPLDCASDEAKQLVLDIAKRSSFITPAPQRSEEGVIEVEQSLRDIRTESKDDKIKKSTCSARYDQYFYVTIYKEADEINDKTLRYWSDKCCYDKHYLANKVKHFPINKKVDLSDYSPHKQITYKIQITSDGKFYATVYGLPEF
jgi:hypothetical protein